MTGLNVNPVIDGLMPKIAALAAALAAVMLMAMSLATLGYFHSYERYGAVGPDWIPPTLNADWPGKITRESGLSRLPQKWVIENDDAKKAPGLHYVVPAPASRWLRLSGQFSISDVVLGSRPWETARAQLSGIDEAGKSHSIGGTAVLFSEVGRRDVFAVSTEVEIPPQFGQVRMTVELLRATGELQIHALSLLPIAETANSKRLYTALLVGWLLAAMLLAIVLWHYLRSLPVVLMVIVVSLPLIVSSDVKQSITHAVQASVVTMKQQFGTSSITVAAQDTAASIPTVNQLITTTQWLTNEQQAYVREGIGHFLTFVIFALLVCWPRRRAVLSQQLIMVGGLFTFAAATEVFQNLVPGRTPSFSDFYANCAGVILGLALIACWRLASGVVAIRRPTIVRPCPNTRTKESSQTSA
jgi:VanZ family protein